MTYGGLKRQIIFHRIKDVNSFIYNDVTARFILKANALPLVLNVVEKTGSYVVEEREKDSETYYFTTISAVVSNVSKINSSMLSELKKEEWFVIIETLTGSKKVVGTNEVPCKIIIKERVTADHSFNGYDLSVECNSVLPPLFL